MRDELVAGQQRGADHKGVAGVAVKGQHPRAGGQLQQGMKTAHTEQPRSVVGLKAHSTAT